MSALLFAQTTEWSAAHPAAAPWLRVFGSIAPWVLAVVLLAMIVHGLWTHARYRAVSAFLPEDRERVRAMLAEAEQRTTGEIVPVVLERSDAHPNAEWIAALALLLVGSVLLAGVLPWDQPVWLLACQLALGAIGFALARWLPGFKRQFVTQARADAMAEEQAFQEFYRNGLHRTAKATGVLLFVSLFERRSIVLADEGISGRVGSEHWNDVNHAILGALRRGSLPDGLIEGIRRAGDELALHFPADEENPNEIEDHLIVRRE